MRHARLRQRRPAALKTGTSNDAKDLNAYGYIAPPSKQGRRNGEYALAVGVWAGNSNASPVTTVSNPVFSLDVAAPLWDAFLTDVTRSWESAVDIMAAMAPEIIMPASQVGMMISVSRCLKILAMLSAWRGQNSS